MYTNRLKGINKIEYIKTRMEKKTFFFFRTVPLPGERVREEAMGQES